MIFPFHFTQSCPLWKLVNSSSAAMGAPALQADLGASSGAVLAPTHPTRRDGADGEFRAARPHWHSSPSGGSLCLDGKGVPTLYLIGAQKSGTTALGTLIFNAGGVSAGFERGVHSGSAKELNVLHVPSWPNVCNETATTAVQRRAWASSFVHECSSSSHFTLTDMTANYYSQARLPTILAEMHLRSASKLSLAIILREPVSRMQSSFYWSFPKSKPGDFAAAVQGLRQQAACSWLLDDVQWEARELGECKSNSKLVRDCPSFQEFLVGSLYGRHLDAWLRGGFSPHQFTVLPMGWVLEQPQGAIASLVSERTRWDEGFPTPALDPVAPELLDPVQTNLSAPEHRNDRAHPTLEEDLGAEQLGWLRGMFFDDDAERLAQRLAGARRLGLVVGGCDDTTCADAAGLKARMASTWNPERKG